MCGYGMKLNDYVITKDNIVFKVQHINGSFITGKGIIKGYHKDDVKVLSEYQLKILGVK